MDAARKRLVPEPLATVPDAEILQILQRAGPMPAEALAAAASMSRTAVLRRLAAFGAAGLVERRVLRRGVGRPRYLYDVTADAQGYLDSRYGALAGSLVDAMVEIGGQELIARVLDARRRRSTSVVRRRFADRGVDAAPLADRVRELAAWQDEHGFTADVSDARGLRLIHHNCPIPRIALASPAACDAELRMIADVLEADVERESLIATGARRCIYRIEARAPGFTGPTWRSTQMRTSDRVPAQPAQEPPPVWRREQMLPQSTRSVDGRATRWPPSGSSVPVVRRDRSG